MQQLEKKRKKKKKEKSSGLAAEIKGRKEGGIASSFWLLGQEHSEKKGDFFWAFGQHHSPNWSCKERRFLYNYSSKAGFLSLAAFGRRFLLLFSVFFFISYFQFVLEDD